MKDVKQRIRNINGKKLLVAPFRLNGMFCIKTNKRYEKVLEELQTKLLYLDVCECETQEVTVVFHTDYNEQLYGDVEQLIKTMRYKVKTI